MEIFASVCLGFGLAAATGLRVFIPLLVLNLAARFDFVTLQPDLEWVGSTGATIAFLVAAIFEVSGYLIPFVDNLLDTVATPAAALAGTLVMGSVLTDMSPLWTWSLAIIAGGGTAAVIQGTTVAARAASTATTVGMANPAVSATETAGSVGLSFLAIAIPIITALVVVVAVAYILYKVPQLIRRMSRRRPPATPPA